MTVNYLCDNSSRDAISVVNMYSSTVNWLIIVYLDECITRHAVYCIRLKTISLSK